MKQTSTVKKFAQRGLHVIISSKKFSEGDIVDIDINPELELKKIRR